MQRRKESGQLALGVGAVGSPQERGLLYKPELQSVADRVRYIERASSRYAHLPAALKSAPPGMRARILYLREYLAAGLWYTHGPAGDCTQTSSLLRLFVYRMVQEGLGLSLADSSSA